MEDVNTAVIVSARMGSTRLPKKAIRPIQGIEMLRFLFQRLKNSKKTKFFIFATTLSKEDEVLVEIANQEGFNVFRGSTDNLVSRYYQAASYYDVDLICRVTGDCPFVNGEMIDYCLGKIIKTNFDLATTKGNFPVGLDAEFFRKDALKNFLEKDLLSSSQKEHLTLYFYENKEDYYIKDILPPEVWISDKSFTVDVKEDYDFASELAERFENPNFSIAELINRVQ